MTLMSQSLSQETKKLHGHHVHLITEDKEEDYLKEHVDRPIMRIYEECDENFLKKILKSFEFYFDIYQVIEGEKRNEILVYPLGSFTQKQNDKKYFNTEVSPKDIAQYLLTKNENRVMPLKLSSFQSQIQNSIANLKKLPVVLIESKEEKNKLINFRTLPYIKEFSERYDFFYMDEQPEAFEQQFQLKKYPAVMSFQMQPAEQEGQFKLVGVPFQQALSFKNLVQFLQYMSQEADKLNPDRQTEQEQQEEKINFDTSINEFTTNDDPKLKKCENKLCVLVFTQQYFQDEEKLNELKKQLENVQGFFNKESTEVFLLDAGCNQKLLPMFELSWDFLPNLIILQKSKNQFYKMQELFTTDGMKRAIIKAQKNITQPQRITEEFKIQTDNCQEVNDRLKKRLEEMNKAQEDEDDEIMKEVIKESQKKEEKKFVQKKSKKERRQERQRRKREREKQEKMEELQLIIIY